MPRFSDKRFVDIGQTLYTTWLSELQNVDAATEDQVREVFSKAANLAFTAAEEFAKVFEGQEEQK